MQGGTFHKPDGVQLPSTSGQPQNLALYGTFDQNIKYSYFP